jgi:hypothetical protein
MSNEDAIALVDIELCKLSVIQARRMRVNEPKDPAVDEQILRLGALKRQLQER